MQAKLRVFEDDDATCTLREISTRFEDAAQALVARAVRLGFGWYVAYWPWCPRGIFRIKSDSGRAEWDRRTWRWFGGARPTIECVTESVPQLCRELITATARNAAGVRFCADTRARASGRDLGLPGVAEALRGEIMAELGVPAGAL